MGKSNDIIYSVIKNDEDKLNEFSVFDRIINLKLKTKQNPADGVDTNGQPVKVANEFVIRSDYEITYPASIGGLLEGDLSHYKKYVVKRCDVKPSIKIQYNQVTDGTAIAVDIYINNFYLLTKDGRSLMNFNSKDYSLAEIEIQMGYIGQFNKALGLDHRDVSSLTVEDLFKFDTGSDSGIQTLTVGSANYIKTDSVTPDYVLHIQGYVGSTITNAIIPEEKDLKYSSLLKGAINLNKSDKREGYDGLFFKYITRRYLNHPSFEAKESLPEADKDGFYSEEDATEYGTQVFCSKGVKELKPLQEKKDNDGNVISGSVETVFSMGGVNNTAHSAIERVLEYTDRTLCSMRLMDGNFLVFLSSELEDGKIEELYKDMKAYLDNNMAGKYYNNIIPAVYNVSIDALAVITCPFFAWINPFQELKFASRYVTSTMTAYYAGYAPDIVSFFVTNVQVSFATTEDINEMQITAVPKYQTQK